ncbi:hypothetical protein KCP70_19130 [Salmonella enterica subsp. enterica]|nr:hypothetical protein KCP70_19130 [Salmonella enterica subsp. enterica]
MVEEFKSASACACWDHSFGAAACGPSGIRVTGMFVLRSYWWLRHHYSNRRSRPVILR